MKIQERGKLVWAHGARLVHQRSQSGSSAEPEEQGLPGLGLQVKIKGLGLFVLK